MDFFWGNANFSTSKAYKILIGERLTHLVFHWIWNSKCQMKHKVFFWLLLQDRLSTRDLLRRRNMELDSYTCELCILQRPETVAHLFLHCNFAKACWDFIGVSVTTIRTVPQIFRKIKDKLSVPFFMEIIILMTWSIWKTRNDWIFNGIDPSVQECRRRLQTELTLLLLRARPDHLPGLNNLMQSL